VININIILKIKGWRMDTKGTKYIVANILIFIRFLFCICTALMILGVFCTQVSARDDTVVRLGNNIVIEKGKEVGGAVSIGGDVEVYGHVLKDVVCVGGTVLLGQYAVVRGDVVSVGGTVIRQEGAQVHGSITIVDTSELSSLFSVWPGCSFPQLPRTYGFFSFLGFMIIALIVVSLIPDTVGFISFNIEHGTVKVFLWGILGAVLILPITIILAISIVGIVLIPLHVILMASAFLMGYIAFVQLLGKKITVLIKKPNKPILLETLIGSIALWFIGFVPFLGWLVKALAAILGFGGVITSIIARRIKA
jgi:hypothetical protein